MKSRFILIALLLCVCSLRAQYNFEKLDAWLQSHAADMGGRAMLVICKDGKVVYSSAANEMTRRQKMAGKLIARRTGKTVNLDDFTRTTRQPIASCSKWLSAALVMTFVDEGKLRTDDTVGKFLPVLSEHGKGNITISQCLSHMTGIHTSSLKDDLQAMRSMSSMGEAMEAIAGQPMEGEPGTVFHYSNAGLQIAGAVIEKIAGKSFETLFAERIAKPLEMKNTDFGKGKVPLPAGGAQSTPDDYINFLVMIQHNGVFSGKRVLSEKSVREMQINRVTPEVKVVYSPPEAGKVAYGYGEWVMNASTVSSPGLFGSFPWVNMAKGYSGFLMAYSLNNNGRKERYAELMELVNNALK